MSDEIVLQAIIESVSMKDDGWKLVYGRQMMDKHAVIEALKNGGKIRNYLISILVKQTVEMLK